MRGRKKTPARIHLLHGNPGHRAINDREPKPETGVPKKPDFLSATAKKYWNYHARRLDKAGILAKVDLGVFAAYCTALATLDKAEKMLEGHGYTQHTVQNGEKKSPWVLIAKEARDQIRSLGSELGVTASSRARIKVETKEKVDPVEAYQRLKPPRKLG
jgi:P27 family predicted phage terminase small subunit